MFFERTYTIALLVAAFVMWAPCVHADSCSSVHVGARLVASGMCGVDWKDSGAAHRDQLQYTCQRTPGYINFDRDYGKGYNTCLFSPPSGGGYSGSPRRPSKPRCNGVRCHGKCYVRGTVCCKAGNVCKAGYICTENRGCLSRRNERVCSNHSYCPENYRCHKNTCVPGQGQLCLNALQEYNSYVPSADEGDSKRVELLEIALEKCWNFSNSRTWIQETLNALREKIDREHEAALAADEEARRQEEEMRTWREQQRQKAEQEDRQNACLVAMFDNRVTDADLTIQAAPDARAEGLAIKKRKLEVLRNEVMPKCQEFASIQEIKQKIQALEAAIRTLKEKQTEHEKACKQNFAETAWCRSDGLGPRGQQRSPQKHCIDGPVKSGSDNFSFTLNLSCTAPYYMAVVETYEDDGTCTRDIIGLIPKTRIGAEGPSDPDRGNVTSSSKHSEPRVIDVIAAFPDETEEEKMALRHCYFARHRSRPCSCASVAKE